MHNQTQQDQFIFFILVAIILWYVTFAVGFFNFWLKISLSASLLAVGSLLISNPVWNEYQFNGKVILIGLLSSILLYAIFWTGNLIAGVLFDFSDSQVASIYEKGDGTNPVIITFLLLLVTSPAEEIFWRGYIQKNFMDKYGNWIGFISGTLIYGFVHVWSMNFMLVAAAMVAGAFWGLMYMKFRNIPMLIISHALWTLSVFVLWPIH